MPSSRAATRRSPPGTTCPRTQAGPARQMEVYAGLPGPHRPPRRPARRHARGSRSARRHAGLLHHRRQRGVGRRHGERQLQRDVIFNGAAALETVEFLPPKSKSSAVRTPTTTTPSVGRTPWTPPYQWAKQVASHWGGTRNGMVVHWPRTSRRLGVLVARVIAKLEPGGAQLSAARGAGVGGARASDAPAGGLRDGRGSGAGPRAWRRARAHGRRGGPAVAL